jgi:hypothetical protein
LQLARGIIGLNLTSRLADFGLFLRGVTSLSRQETEDYGFPLNKASIALVGNIGSSYWPHFSRSDEYLDGAGHPLDRWSRRVAQEIATELPVVPVYPFDGPPYYPFQQWARRAEDLLQSPLGIMMHPDHGLWHSYRFALLGDEFENDEALPSGESPCLTCEARPCLHSCPVGAFDDSGYDVDRCATHLQQTPQADCNTRGCQARYACPVAPGLRYTAAQSRFHLSAFLDARK